MKKVLLVLTILVLIFQIGFSGLVYAPTAKLYQEETENFKFVFEKELYYVFEELEEFSEEVYSILKEFYGIDLPKISVYILDDVDFVNGFAAIPLNIIRLYINKPFTDMGLFDHPNQWFKQVFAHELNHMFYGNLVKSGFVNMIPIDILKVILNNSYTPSYIHEGLSIFTESVLFEGSRFEIDLYQMYLKTEVLRDDFPRYKYGGGAPINLWTPAGFEYMYGVILIREIQESYGEDVLKNIIYDLNSGFFNSISKSFETITGDNWNVFLNSLKIKFIENNEKLLEKGYTDFFEKIDNTYKNTRNLKSDGKALFSYKDSPNMIKGVYKNEELILKNVSNFDVSSSGGLLYLTSVENFGSQKNELFYVCDCLSTDFFIDDRVRKFAFIDDNNIVYSKLDKGMEAVYTYNIEFNIKRKIIDYSNNIVFSDFEGANNKFYFVAYENDQSNIFYYDLKTKEIFKVTSDDYNYMDLFFHNNFLYFSSNREDRVYNVYRINTSDNIIEKLTNNINGAFSPTVVANIFYYTAYTSDGYHIAKLDTIKALNSLNIEKPFKHDLIVEKYDLENLEVKFNRYKKPFPYIISLPDIVLKNDDEYFYGINNYFVDKTLNYNGYLGFYTDFENIGFKGSLEFDFFTKNAISFDYFEKLNYSIKVSNKFNFWLKSRNIIDLSATLSFQDLKIKDYILDLSYISTPYSINNYSLYDYSLSFKRTSNYLTLVEKNDLIFSKPFVALDTKIEPYIYLYFDNIDISKLFIGTQITRNIWSPYLTLQEGKYRFDAFKTKIDLNYDILSNKFNFRFFLGFEGSIFYWIKQDVFIPII